VTYVKENKNDYDNYVRQNKYENNDEHTNRTSYCNANREDHDKYIKEHKNDYDHYSTAKEEYTSQNYVMEHKIDYDYYVKQHKYEGNDPYTNFTYYTNEHKQDYDKYAKVHENDYDRYVSQDTTATTGMEMTQNTTMTHDTMW
jgi:hypothetical protein